MDSTNLFDCIYEVRMLYSKLLIDVGMKRLEQFPEEDPAKFIQQFFLPREEILENLRSHWKKIQKKKSKSLENLNEKISQIESKLKDLGQDLKCDNSVVEIEDSDEEKISEKNEKASSTSPPLKQQKSEKLDWKHSSSGIVIQVKRAESIRIFVSKSKF